MIVKIPENCHFTVFNIPFGVFSLKCETSRRIGTAIGEYAVDLLALIKNNVITLKSVNKITLESALSKEVLNDFMELSRPVWKEMRCALIDFFSNEQDFHKYQNYFFNLDQVVMHLPINIGDYTDFYASKEHASNVGEIFRGKDNALMPNWLHLPVGYHGRASSLISSGTPIKRPSGQMKPPEGPPIFGPTKKLDFELEMAFVIGKGNALGTSIKCNEAIEHIFGVCLMNDWSARDIQAWEYVPLGPFLGKSFATTLSPWIVTLDALEPFLVQGPEQSPAPLDYLKESPNNTSYDVNLEVKINGSTVCKSNLKYLYWTFSQQLAHHTVNGCNMRIGDICGTGTISGPSKDSFGSMLELSWNGTQKILLADGTERTYLNDGDEVLISGYCKKGDIFIGFGDCGGKILPSHNILPGPVMAGKQHESRHDQDSPRKGQISDEFGKKNHAKKDMNYDSHEIIQKLYEDGLELDVTNEETKKNGIFFYTLSIMNETNKICFRSYARCIYSEILFHILSILTLGIPYILMKWWPALKCRWLMNPCPFSDADFLLAINSFNQIEILSVYNVAHSTFGKFKKFKYRYIPFFIKKGNNELFSVKDLDPFASVSIVEELMSSGSLVPEKYKFFLGKNLVDLDRKSYFRLFVDEIAHPFNVFQIASIIIWLYEDYYLYALSIFLISVMSSGITLYETHTNNEKLRNISRFSCKIKILNDGKFLEIDSSELAPGNIVALDSSVEICPCDLILIKGDAIVDESMLTGESVPVSKVSLNEHSDSKFDFSLKNTSNAIYCGTKILRSRGTLSEPALGLVLKTGFETEKGQLILSILFPRPINFNFYSDSMKYIFILGVIAVLGFFLSLYNQLRLKTTKYYIFSRALDLITVVVPPALPATMSIGTVFSLNRLKRKMIHCISPSKINVSSKIDVFCFDKTGTLTEEGLDLYGIAPSGQENLKLQSARYLNEKYSDLKLIECMAVCHSLQIIDNILVGDPLEIKMFESSNWTLEENYDSFYRAIVKPPLNISIADNNGIGILRCFDFCSELRRTSVLTKNLSSGHFMAYCKGSPESILQICDRTSIPSNFESILQKYSKNGFRVIGCAQKNLSNYSNLNIMCLSREYIESKMSFLGFLIFENKIKKQSPKAICQLSLANIKTAMVTGDNILTAICVSRSCGIVRPNEIVFLPSSETLISTFIDSDSNAVISFQDLIMQPESIVFACSGVFLKLLLSNVPHQTAEAFVKRCKIFARMSPEDKKLLVEFIQSTGLTVGFCGDGANDCGALKAADIGISLSDSEASVAAPFSSNSKNISCVISVLLEGRASLATSFSCFKFMALYSMIQFTSLILLYCFGSSLGDNQFVYIDLILILPLGMLMSRFQPSRVLVPKQPETKLISPSVLFSLLSQILYQALAQVYIYCLVIFQPEHEIPFMIPGQPNTQNQENTTVFLLSIFLYLFAATIFCSWKPFRSFYIPFYFYVFTLIVFTIFIIFNPKFGLDKLFEIVPISFEIKKSIVIVSSVYYCVSLLSEFFFKPKIIRLSWPVRNFNFNFKRNKI